MTVLQVSDFLTEVACLLGGGIAAGVLISTRGWRTEFAFPKLFVAFILLMATTGLRLAVIARFPGSVTETALSLLRLSAAIYAVVGWIQDGGKLAVWLRAVRDREMLSTTKGSGE